MQQVQFKGILILIFLISHVHAVWSQVEFARVKVTCTNFQGEILEGEEIWFKSKKTSKIEKGISNSSGIFLLELSGPDEYKIIVKSIGKSSDYSQLILPVLPEGRKYGIYEISVEIDPPREFTLNNVYFETGKSALKSESFSELEELFGYLQRKKTTVIEISGHTDNVGDTESNLVLSKSRAESVKEFLVNKGIDGKRIITRGYGEANPIAGNETDEGRRLNRRTEVRVIRD